jgi:KTSC domain
MATEESGQPGSTDSRAEAEGDQRSGPLDEKEKKEEGAEWKNLSSSNVTQYKYDKNTKEMVIVFHGGRPFAYSGVDQATADGLQTAASAGSYVHKKIKGRFPFTEGYGQASVGGGGGGFRGKGASGDW